MFHDAKLYEEAYDQAVRNNEEAIAAIEEFKKEVEGAKQTLEENQKHLFQPIMAQLAGGKALMRAKLIHTNDVMVFLGDKWFLRTSTARAIDICNRKIARCNENKAEIEQQTERFSSNREKVQEYDLFSGVDLVEPYDDEAEKLWREKHREKVREFKKQEADERKKVSDEDLFRKLSMAEAEDNNSDSNETDDETDLDSSDEDSVAETVEAEPHSSDSNKVLNFSNFSITSQKTRCVANENDETSNEVGVTAHPLPSSKLLGFSDEKPDRNTLKLHEVLSDFSSVENNRVSPSTFDGSHTDIENMNGTSRSDSSYVNENISQNQSAPKKRVSFSTTDELKCYLLSESDDDTNVIRFKHSDVIPSPDPHKTGKIESPSDIYQLIVQGFNPKSILKKGTKSFPEDMPPPTETEREWKTRFITVCSEYNSPADRQEVIFGDISEKNPIVVSKTDSSSRKPSQFRKARNKQ